MSDKLADLANIHIDARLAFAELMQPSVERAAAILANGSDSDAIKVIAIVLERTLGKPLAGEVMAEVDKSGNEKSPLEVALEATERLAALRARPGEIVDIVHGVLDGDETD